MFPHGVRTIPDSDGEENPDSPHEVRRAAHESEINQILRCIQLDSGGDGSSNTDPESVCLDNIDSNGDTDEDLEYVDSDRPLTPRPVEPGPGNGNTTDLSASQNLPRPLKRTFAFSVPATAVVEASSPAAEVQEPIFPQDNNPHPATIEPVEPSRKPVPRGRSKKVPDQDATFAAGSRALRSTRSAAPRGSRRGA